MEPTIRAGDWLIGENLTPTQRISRGELLEVDSGGLGSLRVVGLPGDRIQIKNGLLIRNGVAVPEPYCNFYSDADGDFSRPSHTGQSYTVPDGYYFMLNDNRKQLGDSRTIGPIPREFIVARLIAAYPNVWTGLALPRIIQ